MKKILTFMTIISLFSSQIGNICAISTDYEKEQILNKMLNSVDYFETVSGQFTLSSNKSNVVKEVYYCVQNNEQQKSYEKVYSKQPNSMERNQVQEITERIYDGNHRVLSRESGANRSSNGKIIDISRIPNSMSLDTSSRDVQDRMETKEDGTTSYYYRNNSSGIAESKISLLPEEITFNFLNDRTLWSVKGEEIYLNYKAIRISGELSTSNKERYNAVTFYMLVDQNTGILLEFSLLNGENNSTESLVTNNILINQPINDEIFNSYSEEISSYDEENKSESIAQEISPYYDPNVDAERSIVIDNDQSTINGYSATSYNFDSSYYTGNNGYFNDYRLATPYQTGSYQWFFTGDSGWNLTSFNVAVYLANGDFTNSSTCYRLIDSEIVNSDNKFFETYLNQNYSPVGWNVIAQNLSHRTNKAIALFACPWPSSGDGMIGIDAASLYF